MVIERPAWADYLEAVGRNMTALGPCEYGEPAPRAVVSVPTGRFTYWLLASGAFQTELPPFEPAAPGDRAATWLPAPEKRMGDTVLEADGEDRWVIGGSIIPRDRLPVVALPDGAPDGRGGAAPKPGYRDVLRELPGRHLDWHYWYAAHCIRPVVIVGTGYDHIQVQREMLLDHARNWFPEDVAALMDDDTLLTRNPERMFFHPFMVFDAGVGDRQEYHWLREVKPRLVIVTSWSSYTRMNQQLFSRSPQIIVTNRRVASAHDAAAGINEFNPNTAIDAFLDADRPTGVFSYGFSRTAQGAADEEYDEELI